MDGHLLLCELHAHTTWSDGFLTPGESSTSTAGWASRAGRAVVQCLRSPARTYLVPWGRDLVLPSRAAA